MLYMDTRTLITQMLTESSLSVSQKELWTEVLRQINDEDLRPIFEVLAEYPEQLTRITNNLEAKMEALRSNDTEKWAAAITDDIDFITSE